MRIPSTVPFALLLFAPVTLAGTYSIVNDFATTSNPNGVWSYYVSGALYPLADGDGSSCPFGMCWNNYTPFPYSGTIVRNTTSGLVHDNSTTYVPINYLQLDPQGLNLAIVFTAPAAAQYQIAGQFLAIDQYENPHPVSVAKNGATSLYSGITGAYAGTNPFAFTLSLAAGDTIAFDVGTGFSGCSVCNLSTGLFAEITTSTTPIVVPDPFPALPALNGGGDGGGTGPISTPEPREWGVLAGGLACLAVVGLRKNRGTARPVRA